jgi:hypothetical protein
VWSLQYTGRDIPLFSTLRILQGDYADFNRGWYSSVGVSLCVTMVINLIVPHATLLLQLLTRPFKIFFGSAKAVTQEQINSLYEGPTFEIETRFALLLNTLVITLAFAAGLPILLAIAAVNYVLSFAIDKYALCRFYSSPPNYTESLAQLVASVFPLALIAHLCLSCWMLSNEMISSGMSWSASRLLVPCLISSLLERTGTLTSYTSSLGVTAGTGTPIGNETLFGGRISRLAAFPLFLLLLIYISAWILHAILGEHLVNLVRGLLGRRGASFSHTSSSGGVVGTKERVSVAYTAIYERRMTDEEAEEYQRYGKLSMEYVQQGFRVREDGETLYKVSHTVSSDNFLDKTDSESFRAGVDRGWYARRHPAPEGTGEEKLRCDEGCFITLVRYHAQ